MKSDKPSKIFLILLILAISFLHAEKIRSKDNSVKAENISVQNIIPTGISFNLPASKPGLELPNLLKLLP